MPTPGWPATPRWAARSGCCWTRNRPISWRRRDRGAPREPGATAEPGPPGRPGGLPDEDTAVTRVIAGAARGRRLAVPAGRLTRPTSDRARGGLFGPLL